ncbi:MAG: hypothetical protein ACK56F_10535, partial [bacterium]
MDSFPGPSSRASSPPRITTAAPRITTAAPRITPAAPRITTAAVKRGGLTGSASARGGGQSSKKRPASEG